MSIFSKPKPETSSEFSRFIRQASSAEKKKVYSDVIKRASDRQAAIAGRLDPAASR
jgi:hypothetical protein